MQKVGTRWIEKLMPPVVAGAIVALIGLNLAPAAPLAPAALARADLIVVNETEAAFYGPALNDLPGLIAVTWGARGAGLFQAGRQLAAAAPPPVEAVDATGAGDAFVGALVGFLWWNCNPAQIFMGDTGSLALGGALAGVSILSATEFLAVIIGGLFVLEVISDVIQIGVFKATRKRVFRMAPLQHHFELKGWAEVNVVVRFWILAGLFVAVSLSIFYGDWLMSNGGSF